MESIININRWSQWPGKEVVMLEIILICILGVATLLGLMLWLSFIAGKEQEHVNPDIREAECRRDWAPDEKESGRKPGMLNGASLKRRVAIKFPKSRLLGRG